MAKLEDINTALDRIDAATTQQGEVLVQEAETLQEISDDMDKVLALLANASGVPSDLVARIQAHAERTEAVSESLKAQAEFSKSIAAKHSDPVPDPVPEPTPEPT